MHEARNSGWIIVLEEIRNEWMDKES
jgi:hypothetical protein